MPRPVGKRCVKLLGAFDQLPSGFFAQRGEEAGFGVAHFFGQPADVGAALLGQAEDFLAAVFVVLHDVDLALVEQFVALGGNGLFGQVPHVADVFLRAVFAVVECVEDDKGGVADAFVFGSLHIQIVDAREQLAEFVEMLVWVVVGDFAVFHGVFCLLVLLSLAARADNGETALNPAPDSEGYPGKATEVSLGIAGGYANNEFKGYSGSSSVSPVLTVESRRFYVRGLSAGVKLYTAPNQSQELLLGATYLYQYRFKPHKSKDAQIKRLDERKEGVMLDLAYNFYTPYGNLETQVSHDISGRSKGMRAQTQYSYFWQPTDKLTLTPAVGISYADRRFNQYYYGISAAESERSGLAAYRPKASLEPYTEIAAEYRFAPHWSAFAIGRVEQLPKTLKDSPMVDKGHRVEGTVGVSYNF